MINESVLKCRLHGTAIAHSFSLCLATVVWNPHTSSGTSMISEGGLFVLLTVHSIYYYAPPATLQQIVLSHWTLPTLSVCKAVNEVNILSLECLPF